MWRGYKRVIALIHGLQRRRDTELYKTRMSGCKIKIGYYIAAMPDGDCYPAVLHQLEIHAISEILQGKAFRVWTKLLKVPTHT